MKTLKISLNSIDKVKAFVNEIPLILSVFNLPIEEIFMNLAMPMLTIAGMLL